MASVAHASAPLAERLPYLLTRTVATDDGPVGVVVNRDGTVSVGFEAPGIDLFCCTNQQVNDYALGVMSALNTLAQDTYLQVIYESGSSYRQLLKDSLHASACHDNQLLVEGRRHRIRQFVDDPSLLRLRLVFWLGCKRSVQLYRSPKKSFHKATSKLLVQAARLRDALEALEWKVELFSEERIVTELHAATNPLCDARIPPPCIVDTPEALAQLEAGSFPVWRGDDLAGQLALSNVVVDRSFVSFERYGVRWRAFGVARYPRTLAVSWLHRLARGDAPHTPFRISVTHNACDQGAAETKYGVLSNLYQTIARMPFASTAAALAAHDSQRVCDLIGTSEQKLLTTSFTAHVSGRSDSELAQASEAIQRVFADTNPPTPTDVLTQEQLPAWLASLPAYGYSHPFEEPVSSLQAACMTPLSIPSIGDERQPDLLFHTRQRSVFALTLREIDTRQDSNCLVVGKTGSGKTLLELFFLLYGCLDIGGHAVVADNKGPDNSAYRPMAELYGGRYYNLDPKFGTGMSPCPAVADVVRGGECDPQALSELVKLLWLIVKPDGNGYHRDYYDDVLMGMSTLAYVEAKNRTRPVRLQDIRDAHALYRPPNDTAAAVSKEIRQRLDIWCRHAVRGPLLNAETPLDFTERLVIYDFYGIRSDPDLCGVLMSLLTQRVHVKLNSLPRTTPKFLLFDEAWEYLLNFAEAASLLDTLARTTRSYGAALHLATQAGKDLLKSAHATGILDNLALHIFLRAAAGHDATATAYGFSPRERSLYKQLRFIGGEYSEFLLLDVNRGASTFLQFRPPAFHLWNCSTRPSDVEVLSRYTAKLGSRLAAVRYLAERFPNGTPKTKAELEHDYAGEDEKGDAHEDADMYALR
jgi:hypothetical protein